MKTRLDVERENAIIKADREKNIKELTKQLNEAKGIQAVIPNNHSYETGKEQRIVAEKIKHIYSLIESEKDAIKSLPVYAADMDALTNSLKY